MRKLEKYRKERERLENKLAMIESMGSGIKKNKVQTEKNITELDGALHEVTLALKDAKRQLKGIDKLLTDSNFIRKRTKEDLLILRKKLSSLRETIQSYDAMALSYEEQLDEAREELVMSTVGSASKETITKAYERAVVKETKLLTKLEKSGSETSGYRLVRRMREKVRKLKKRNRKLQKTTEQGRKPADKDHASDRQQGKTKNGEVPSGSRSDREPSQRYGPGGRPDGTWSRD